MLAADTGNQHVALKDLQPGTAFYFSLAHRLEMDGGVCLAPTKKEKLLNTLQVN